jgi:hypothetical protein
MSAQAGLGGANIRLEGPDRPDLPPAAEVSIEMAPPGGDIPEVDTSGNILRIKHGDGELSVSINGQPLGSTKAANDEPLQWYSNLADKIPEDALNSITEDLLRGIEEDLQSRKEWVEDRALCMKLLGLKIELPNTQGASDGAPVEGMSKVRHPLLLEAVLRFQANARSELLPTDGPVKIRNDSNDPSAKMDQDANALERDMNHYLTTHASEYYPDTDRMLFMTGFGGTGFKKVYFCPIRSRPVSESVDADDIIVNQSATDLQNAQRVTHRTMMRPSTLKRLQLLKVYRDIELGDPMPADPDELQRTEKDQQGITPDALNVLPQNREREIYECYCELDIPGFEHKQKREVTGLQIPYIFTIDKSSRRALAVTRNFDEDDQELPTARKKFVKFPFVPGIGFYDIGLSHILGNSTNAITAAWRLMLDNGMFANFPGFLISKSGTRQNTNILRVPPGGSAQIDTQGLPIGQSVMPLPYETTHMAPLMSLVQDMAETGRRVGGTTDIEVGEGRADVPVGTVLALIDQALKVMSAVHKRMCASQAEELQLLKQVFREHPESFYQRKCKSKTPWDKARFLAALDNCDFVPQADPNTASAGQRAMKVVALKQLQQASPNLYDPIKCDTAALASIGWPNPEEFFVPPAARSQPPPQLVQAQEQMKNESTKAQADMIEAQARAKEAGAKETESQAKVAGVGAFTPKQPEAPASPEAPEQTSPLDVAKAHATVMDAETRRHELGLRAAEIGQEDRSREQDAKDRERESAINLAADVIRAPTTEGGGQVSVKGAGRKAKAIIKDVDKGVK